MSVFRIFDPKGPKQDPVEKRRQQLRQAQRTYRDKNVKYTKSLEEELARVRTREALLMKECERMHETIDSLVSLLVEHDVRSPSPILKGLRDLDHGRAIVKQSNTPGSNVENSPAASQASWSPYHHSPGGGSITNDRDQAQRAQSGTVIYSHANDRESVRVCNLSSATVGMEFVLSLEEPCRDHLHGDPEKPYNPTGHALTTSARMHCLSGSNPLENPHTYSSTNEEVPTKILDHLLSLSSAMCAEDELTPTQAWHSIRQQPHFGGLELKDLQKLASKLRDTINCHGFGAVIKTQTFKVLMFETLIVGRAF
ncbi:hypothetical protein B0O99DRAFT_622977 [Bisporella sp. PMI_857]|nr:hypothetical protein B0O99DRAFT_622977 [Bisporella sp. PMI_857]